jgi:hypothetical protein
MVPVGRLRLKRVVLIYDRHVVDNADPGGDVGRDHGHGISF